MIYKVEVRNQIAVGMEVSHIFETVVDTEQEARDFGKHAGDLAYSFNEGFGVSADEHDE